MDSAFGVRTFCPKLERLYPMISSRSVYSFTSCILSNIYCEVTFIQRKVKHLVLFPLLYLELFQHHLLKRLSFPPKYHSTFAENQLSIKEGLYFWSLNSDPSE